MKTLSFLLPYFNRKEYILPTLSSYLHFYKEYKNIEFIIVDDCSDEKERLEDTISSFTSQGLNIKLIRLSNKVGKNPARPYNIAARNSSGDIFILSSPEIMHTNDIVKTSDFDNFGTNDYWFYSVFCPTDRDVTKRMIAPETYLSKEEFLNDLKGKINAQPGTNGKPSFANEHGSWYLHSSYRPSNLNFLAAISREKYFKIKGFDERLTGTGYDDDEFLFRARQESNIKYFDDFVAIHINHPPVYGSGNPVSNIKMYNAICKGEISRWNDDNWGLI